jgi:alkanesulfonate monooxygenase SsuD/methylene tetrahydromethanopterin reductase-like flavin-dependent oxidoreductase (luciferase family)
LADGFVATYVADPMVLKRQAGWARAGAESAGRDPSQLALAVSVPVFAWEDGVAWDVVQESYHYLSWKYEDLMSWRDRSGSPLPAPSLTTERRQAIRKDIVVGTPEQVTEQVGDLVEAAGGSLHFIARLYFPGLEPSVQEEAVRIFADRVAKVLR